MGRIDRLVLYGIVALAALIAAGLALVYANEWWLSAVMTASILAWLAGVLAAIYSPPERRSRVLAAVLAGFLYILFALGPWFRVHVGPWLLTSQALVQVESKWLSRSPPQAQQILYTTPNTNWSYVTSGGGMVMTPQVATTLSVVNASSGSPSGHVVLLGHWFCGWIAAGLGSIVAWWMARPRSASAASRAGAEAIEDLVERETAP